MDVSIAVSLIRGQMGAVVERAVNGAVETVLAEMLKVVGVKFEELKAQVVLMKRDIATLQKEKALKEKENDNIRAKLRYTELKLKYYRQGVEEELQQRASAGTLVRIHPSTFLQTHRGGAGVSSPDTSPSCLTQTRTTEGTLTRPSQECISPQSTNRRTIRVRCHSDVGVASTDSSGLLPSVSLSMNKTAESLDSSTEHETAESKEDGDQEDDCEWTITLQPHTDNMDTIMAPLPVQALNLVPGQQPAPASLSLDGSTQVDSSMLPSSAPQVTAHTYTVHAVKQEAQEEEEEGEEVICIKEEPEEEQNRQLQQHHLPESEPQRSVTEWSGPPVSQINHTAANSSAGSSTNPMSQTAASRPLIAALAPDIPSRQVVRPWTKDLSLYEEYKLRRNELRRRSLSRRRELEKTLPQPLLADLVRERREKTRLRVARWRAKRKLQACLSQAQAAGGAADASQTGFPISRQHQDVRVTSASTSSIQQRPQSSGFIHNKKSVANISATLPFITSTSSSSVLLRGSSMAAHPHTVTSSTPPSSYPQLAL
ncbi:uncharacterized protein LOC113123057 isoform X2 [Mastacembelus armatus]|uniref:uncharacterized protein LOC113123057 isoform X2 n=1 Tax=Mastacembelus armatus TaxID=205130 RepID=UPI000E45CF13|nr:uncharacterized protein LOC113123057 isoform X2 [Mastacembelus armatus]